MPEAVCLAIRHLQCSHGETAYTRVVPNDERADSHTLPFREKRPGWGFSAGGAASVAAGGLKPAHNVGNGATRWGVTGLALRAACAAADGERPEGGHGNGEGGPEPINGTQIESCQHKRAKRYQAEHKVAHLAQSSGKQFSIYLLDAPFGK